MKRVDLNSGTFLNKYQPMKKIAITFLLICIFGVSSFGQVSSSFYNYFKSTVQENAATEGNFYSSLIHAAKTCFNLTNEKYQAEIGQFRNGKLPDSVSVKLIPEQTMQRFLEQDFELTFCKGEKEYEDALAFYIKALCENFTPKYEKLSNIEKTKSEAAIIKESAAQIQSDPAFLKTFKEKLSNGSGDVQSLEKIIGP
jgi:hypothetical protein